jgi:uncharacterized protein YjiS (DUF1127 family)
MAQPLAHPHEKPVFGLDIATGFPLRRPARWLAALLRRSSERRRMRRALAKLPDHILVDIGLSRTEAETECAKPFWRD